MAKDGYESERDEIMRQTGTAMKELLPRQEVKAHVLTVLVGGVICDLRRIAAAVEKLSSFELVKAGDVALMKAAGTPEQHLMALTPEERETIEALRMGDIVVVKNTEANEADEIERTAMQMFRDKHKQTRPTELVPVWAGLNEMVKKYWRDEAKLARGTVRKSG